MQGGTLEVLIVSAKGIKHTNLIGKPVYYVNIECGTQTRRTKTSKGHHGEVSWNEKFTFQFPMEECRKLAYLKLHITDEGYLTNGGSVGQTMINLGGVLEEGNDRGVIELVPAPYNVVLEDDTYKGEIKIGLKFTSNTIIQTETEQFLTNDKESQSSIWKKLVSSFWKISCWRFSFICKSLDDGDKYKRI